MALRNINLIQELDDVAIASKEKEYLVQSLANLGQRFSIKGDSLITESISMRNIVYKLTGDKECLSLSNDDYVCSLTAEGISIHKKNKLNETLYDSPLTVGYYDYSTENELIINNATYRSIGIHNETTTFSFICDEQNDNTNNVAILIESYSKPINTTDDYKLLNGIRIFQNNDSVKLVFIYNTSENTYLANQYIYNTTSESISDLKQNIKDYLFENILESTSILNFLNSTPYFVEYPNLQEVEYLYSSNSFTNTDNSSSYNELNNYVSKFNYDKLNILPELKTKWSQDVFNDSENIQEAPMLNCQILFKLYEAISSFENSTKVYVPLDYVFSYTVNSNDKWMIFYSINDIEVKYISEEITNVWMNQNYEFYNDSIIAETSTYDKIVFFGFFVDYDEWNNVNGINVVKTSILPYIGENNQWVINGIKTSIKAKGEDAGNPNIIIVETIANQADNSNYKIKSGANKDILERLDWRYEKIKIEPLEKINMNEIKYTSEFDYFIVNCAIPNLDNYSPIEKPYYTNLFKNSLIINISDMDCIDLTQSAANYTMDSIYNIYGKYGVITSFWTFNEETERFEYITKSENNNAAADFNYITNLNNLIQYVVKSADYIYPDKFEFTHLVFDSIYSDLKNNEYEKKSYIYPNIVNKLHDEYNTNNLGNYANDFNLVFKYNDIVEKDENDRIESISQNSGTRYLNTNPVSSGVANIVTNSLYAYHDSTGRLSKYNEYVPNYNVPSLDLSEVLTRNETLLNRLNILSLDNIGTSYLSYIGSSIDRDKNVLVIGTSNVNVNLGTDTLAFENDKKNFVTQNVLSVDFPNIEMAGDVHIEKNIDVKENIYSNKPQWIKLEQAASSGNSLVTHYTSLFTPKARYIYENRDLFGGSGNTGIVRLNVSGTESNMETLLSYTLYKYTVEKNKLFVISTVQEKYYTVVEGVSSPTRMHNVYLNDGIYLPKLLYDLGLEQYVKYNVSSNKLILENVHVTSNMDILNFNYNPLILLSHSTNLYDQNLYRYDRIYDNGVNSSDAYIENILNFTNTLFTVNPLKITYYVQGTSDLYIQIDEVGMDDKINYVKKIQQNYNKY